jgi:hypothetical protein
MEQPESSLAPTLEQSRREAQKWHKTSLRLRRKLEDERAEFEEQEAALGQCIERYEQLQEENKRLKLEIATLEREKAEAIERADESEEKYYRECHTTLKLEAKLKSKQSQG